MPGTTILAHHLPVAVEDMGPRGQPTIATPLNSVLSNRTLNQQISVAPISHRRSFSLQWTETITESHNWLKTKRATEHRVLTPN